MDRGSTFSDQAIIKRLQTEFIPVVGNTHELQNGRSPARDWFIKMASSVNPRDLSRQTAQGFYIAAADGTGYGFNNNRTVERVTWFMNESLKKWRDNPGKPIQLSEEELKVPFSPQPDPGTAVIRVFSRIKPLPAGCDVLNHGVGRDHFWINREEIQEIWRRHTEKRGAESFEMPSSLVGRLVRFHLVDNVRGEPDMWRGAEVKKAAFSVKGVRWIGGSGLFRFNGSFLMSTADGRRGIEGTIEGEFGATATGDIGENFRAYAEAKAWGAGTYTPRPPEGKFPIVFSFQFVNDEAAKLVPPQGIMWGNEYRNPRTP